MDKKDENLVKAIKEIYEDRSKKFDELVEVTNKPITDILRKAGYLAEDEEVDVAGDVKFVPDEGYSKRPEGEKITTVEDGNKGAKSISLEEVLMVFGYKKTK